MVDEKRRQRKSFTRSLQRIAERIDITSEFKVERMFRDFCTYYLKWEEKSPAIVRVYSDWRQINLIELFRKKADAISFAQEISEETEP